MKPIAFVIPWFGPQCKGGAEIYCSGLAHSLAERGHQVEVLTTCCSSAFVEWSTNDLPEGTTTENGITVRRFKCDKRNADIFAQAWRSMDAGLELTPQEQDNMIRNSINSADMMKFIHDNSEKYLFCFVPYLYGTTINGMQAATDGTGILIPCLHDEPIARLNIFKRIFDKAVAVLFLSEPEKEVALRLFDLPSRKMFLLGGGLSDKCVADSSTIFRKAFPKITNPYLLCVGRKVKGKGSDIALEYYAQMVNDNLLPSNLDFVLIGDGQLEIPAAVKHRVHSIQCVDSASVYAAMRDAIILIQPSLMESFSIVLMEAWLNKRPTLVNGHCAVTRHHVLTSGGGLWFEDYPTFAESIQMLLDSPKMRHKMACTGEKYVRDNWLWTQVDNRFEQIIRAMESNR